MRSYFRCAAASLDRAEPLYGTASRVRAFLLVEVAGSWGVDAVRDCRSLGEVCSELLRRAHAARVRVLLIRRHGRYEPEGVRVFAAYADALRPWMEASTLGSVGELLDLDLARLGAGSSPGLTPYVEPLFCVCTHGRHDSCCAEQGRPLAAALAATHPEHTWEVSHIGGDRFAANVLVLPDGLYYGRVPPSHAAMLADLHLAGELDLDHLRGRCDLSFIAQAADVMLRGHLGVTGIGAVRLVAEHEPGAAGTPGGHCVDFAVDHRALAANGSAALADGNEQVWRVRLHVDHAAPTQLTCRAARQLAAPAYHFIDVAALTP